MDAPRSLGVICVAALVLGAGCDSDGSGDLEIRISGEAAAQQGIPFEDEHAEDGHEHEEGELAFEDGWVVEFDQYLMAIADLEIASSTGETAETDGRVFVVDLHAGDFNLAIFEELPAQRWDRFSYSIRAPRSGDEVVRVGDVTEDDVQKLREGAYNYWIEGRATKGDRTVTFAWGLHNPSRNADCTNGEDGTQGVVVTNNQTKVSEVTVHVEHLFWDTLGSEQTRLRFDAIAAMADPGGLVAWDVLDEQLLADLRDENGDPLVNAEGSPVVYNPASTGAADLQAFILEATRTQAHLGGDGLCTISVL